MVYGTVSELYNKFLDKNAYEYNDLEKEIKEELAFKFKSINLKTKGYDYSKLYNETSDEDYIIMKKRNM